VNTKDEEDTKDAVYNPHEAAAALVRRYKYGDIVPAAQLAEYLGLRLTRPDETYQEGVALDWRRLDRRVRLFKVLLNEHKIFVEADWNGGIELVRPDEQVDRVLKAMRGGVDRELRNATLALSNLDTTGLTNTQITDQHNAVAYADALRQALNPKSRRLKGQLKVEQTVRNEVVVPIPSRSRRL
jgi:hypothetical protein